MTEPKLIARHDFFFPVPRDDNGIPVAQLVKIQRLPSELKVHALLQHSQRDLSLSSAMKKCVIKERH
jgi:hypothetical protein